MQIADDLMPLQWAAYRSSVFCNEKIREISSPKRNNMLSEMVITKQ